MLSLLFLRQTFWRGIFALSIFALFYSNCLIIAQVPNFPSESTLSQLGNMTLVPRGTSVVLPAPLGTTKSILGKGFTSDFVGTDQQGKTFQAFKGTPKTTSLKSPYYKAYFRKMDTQELLAANVRFLGIGSIGGSNEQRKRYGVLSVIYIDKIEVFDQTGAALFTGGYYAKKLYYGWAIHYLISGDERIFTLDVSANLEALAGVGGDFKAEIKQNNLTQSMEVRGLVPIVAGQIAYTPDQVANNFSFDKKNSSPILIEYEALNDVSAKTLSWANKPLQFNTSYRVIDISCTAAETKEGGKAWDSKIISGSPAPDISIECFVNNQNVRTMSGPDNEYSIAVSPNISFTIDNTLDYLYFRVYDRDGIDNDKIGTASIRRDDLLRFSDRQWISLPTTAQLKELLIRVESNTSR